MHPSPVRTSEIKLSFQQHLPLASRESMSCLACSALIGCPSSFKMYWSSSQSIVPFPSLSQTRKSARNCCSSCDNCEHAGSRSFLLPPFLKPSATQEERNPKLIVLTMCVGDCAHGSATPARYLVRAISVQKHFLSSFSYSLIPSILLQTTEDGTQGE